MDQVPVLQARPQTEELQAHLSNLNDAVQTCEALSRVEAFMGWGEELGECRDVLLSVEAKLQDVLVDRLGREGVKKLLLDDYHN